MFLNKLKKYADLIVQKGINIQPDQTLVVTGPVEMAEFIRLIAQSAYAQGAKNVHAEYKDDQLALLKYQMAPLQAFGEPLQWKSDGFEEMAKNGAAFLSLTGTDPDLLQGIDSEKISLANKTNGQSLSAFRKLMMASVVSWCVAAVPSPPWAKKVYPNLQEEEAIAKLWDAIFSITLADQENPIQSWNQHIQNLKQQTKRLNDAQFSALHFQSQGTDLTVELARNHVWVSAEEKNAKGIPFVANMPTEEIFTAPKRGGVNGYVSNTMPFNYSGSLIDGFTLHFEQGKIVKMTAKVGEEVFEKLLNTDEGSRYLGEVALVPDNSPISNTNTIYYNTLFDENASCHLAFGGAYPTNILGGEALNEEELLQAGLNQSIVHHDFMIGGKDMDIDGIQKDGTIVPLFRQGNWV